jgi:hypothetical protein
LSGFTVIPSLLFSTNDSSLETLVGSDGRFLFSSGLGGFGPSRQATIITATSISKKRFTFFILKRFDFQISDSNFG